MKATITVQTERGEMWRGTTRRWELDMLKDPNRSYAENWPMGTAPTGFTIWAEIRGDFDYTEEPVED